MANFSFSNNITPPTKDTTLPIRVNNIIYDRIEGLLSVILAITSGFFIYIALANLIPEIHSQDNQKKAFWETVMLFVGVVVVYFAINVLSNNLSL